MEWLHFSDFHIGGAAGPQIEALGALLDFIGDSILRQPSSVDAVFLAGDIVYSGKAEEYKRFEELFLQPLLLLPALTHAKVFAVPGNHDVDCDAALPITWSSIGKRNQALYFSDNDEGKKTRRGRADVFKHYLDFARRNKIHSPDPFSEVSKFFGDETGLPIDILATNTSFFADKEEASDAAITPCPMASVRQHIGGLHRKRPLIILGHHPVRCFLPDQQKPFETFLIDKQAVYLHGHEHSPSITSNTDGTLRVLGFGASYVAALGANVMPPYRNSFAKCRLDDRLYLNGYSWDPEVGRWDDATRSQFSTGIPTYNGTSICLDIPLLSTKTKRLPAVSPLQNIPRRTPQPQSIALVSPPSSRLWIRLLALSKNINTFYRNSPDSHVQPGTELDGKSEFIIDDAENRDLLICIPGTSHILSAKEIESYNTRLDTEDFRSVTVLSLGKISAEARDMYFRLRVRKHIEVLFNKEIAQNSQRLLSTPQSEILALCDGAKDAVDILVDNDDVLLLIVESAEDTDFRIVNSTGDVLGASDPIVARLRADSPGFSKMRYRGEAASISPLFAPPEFDEDAYLEKCYAENNVMKYAALANVGLRFSDFSLDQVYVDASACEVEPGGSDRIDALLEDHLAAYPASEKLKAQIKQQFHNQTNEDTHEVSQAREFCQKFGAVLITGDPGSGKTCFVKSEILAYSRRAAGLHAAEDVTPDEWHSVHVPVMIQLSQAAAEKDLQAEGLLSIASRLLARRGLSLSREKLEELLKQGRLSLFFDGLDEVVSVERRALVVQHINDLVSTSLPLGNRVVVTSRQAAINVVNLLPTLRQLELQGLKESDIQTLAFRILTLKVSETPEGVVVDTAESRSSDSAIVRQLLEDCREKPGVARLAKNPLLLTLLVMIYANSGAPSAKRHKIYEEAIKTLASVRGRTTGHDPVSAQDLRERLGAVALSVYRKESGFLPTRAEVTEVVRAVMSRQRGENVAKLDADRFIQKVAESTGLIALGGVESRGDDAAVVTFMHHSFMEYFAAVGLSRELGGLDVVSLVSQPRWVEILTLLAGIIGESEDIAPIIGRFIGDGTKYGEVDSRLLTFALDCALECDVPSEAAIRLLSASISKCLSGGPGRCDPWVRSEIGHRLSQLIAACGLSSFEATITTLIRHSDPEICSAGISLAGYACGGDLESTEIIKALEDASSRIDENIQCSICEATARVGWFRTTFTLQVIAKCLKKSNRSKLAAFEAILAIPGLAAKHWPDIINGLDDNSYGLRRTASKAAVLAGLDGDVGTLNDSKKDLVANALQYMYESTLDHDRPTNKVRQETIERLMASGYNRDRLIAIQLIPAVDSSEDYAYQRLMKIVDSSNDHQELTAALGALGASRDAQLLITAADLKRVANLSEAGTSDVRRASIHLLGVFGANTYAVKPLLDRDFSTVNPPEFKAIMSALARAHVLHDEIIALIERELLRRVKPNYRRDGGFEIETCALLDAARDLNKNVRPEVAAVVKVLIKDYKATAEVRKAALRAYPAVAMPTKSVVDFLTSLFREPPPAMIEDLVHTPGIFAKHCRQNVDFVIACVEGMSGLRDAATTLHQRLSKRPITSDTELMISALRDGILAISQIIVTFDEFINPSRLKPA